MKLTMTKGLPASGKSTWAKSQNAYRVNKDDLRAMLNHGKWSKINEKYVLKIRDSIIELYLADKNNVVVDDTNLSPKHEIRLRELAKKHNAQFEIKDFTDVPLEECIKRDQKRPNYVGEKVIRQMYKQFFSPKVEPVAYDATLPFAILCDIDGTLALFGDKNPYERNFIEDDVNKPVKEVVNRFAGEYKIILVSGRTGEALSQTKQWLEQNGISYDHIYMPRAKGDMRKDVIIKQEIYDNHIRDKYNVVFVLDDRNQVVDLWRSLGLTCFQVAEGDF